MTVGVKDGFDVIGTNVGVNVIADGILVGLKFGPFVRIADGVKVGYAKGLNVGTKDGINDGFLVGMKDGT